MIEIKHKRETISYLELTCFLFLVDWLLENLIQTKVCKLDQVKKRIKS